MVGAHPRRGSVAWLLFVLLGSIYLLTYRGTFHSVDELAMYAATESLVQTGSIDTPQLAFAAYHNWVGALEPLQSLVTAPLYAIAVRVAQVGNIQTVMLFNVVVTAGAGALIYLLLRELACPRALAVAVALIYGLATIAWPYSRSFFREPLLALLTAAATYALVRWYRTRAALWALLAVVLLALGVTTKITSVLAWPGFSLAVVLAPGTGRRARWRRAIGLALLVAAGALLTEALYRVRIGGSLVGEVQRLAAWSRLALLPPRLYGLTLGASRGLFVYSPVLLLALPGMALLWRRERGLALLCLVTLIAYLCGYGLYAQWHGGLVWGSRFLVPVVPLLALPLASGLGAARGVWRAGAGLLIAASLLIQVAAATTDSSARIAAQPWDSLTDYAGSPALRQVVGWRWERLDMHWWHGAALGGGAGAHLDLWAAALPLAGVLACAILLVGALRRPAASRRRGVAGALGVLLAASAALLLVRAPRSPPTYRGVDQDELRQLAAIANQDSAEPHVVVTVSNEFLLYPLLDRLKGRFVHYWLSPVEVDGFERLLTPSFPAQRLRLIVDRVHMQPDHAPHAAEYWLNAHLYQYYAEWVGSAYHVYGYLYPPQELSWEVVDFRWDAGMAMSAYALIPRTLAPGEPLWVAFRLTAAGPVREEYDLFLQLLAPDGAYLNGTDGAPQFGAAPTTRWATGETIVDRRACFVPAGAAAGVYHVVAGFYRGGERATLAGGTHVDLGTIEVRAP